MPPKKPVQQKPATSKGVSKSKKAVPKKKAKKAAAQAAAPKKKAAAPKKKAKKAAAQAAAQAAAPKKKAAAPKKKAAAKQAGVAPKTKVKRANPWMDAINDAKQRGLTQLEYQKKGESAPTTYYLWEPDKKSRIARWLTSKPPAN